MKATNDAPSIITVVSPHGLSCGETVEITGFGKSGTNLFVVTDVTLTTFTYRKASLWDRLRSRIRLAWFDVRRYALRLWDEARR